MLTLVQFEDGVGHGRQQSLTLQDVDVPDPEGEGEGSLDTNRTKGQRITSLFPLQLLVDRYVFSSQWPRRTRLAV